jgi:hypothetical protein
MSSWLSRYVSRGVSSHMNHAVSSAASTGMSHGVNHDASRHVSSGKEKKLVTKQIAGVEVMYLFKRWRIFDR